LVVEVSGHLDVPLDTPVSSPRVLDEPISTSAVNSPSDGEDSVVEGGGRASWLVVDSTGVQLEGVLRSIDGNRDGSRVTLARRSLSLPVWTLVKLLRVAPLLAAL